MATPISFSRFFSPKPPSPPKCFNRSTIPPFLSVPSTLSPRRNPRLLRRHFSAQENNGGGSSETLAERKEEGSIKEDEKSVGVDAEIRDVMKARKDERSKADEFLAGVAEEVREIEWPEFRKVVGTTGVVLAVIAGSSVALLTVNAILADLSDRFFAGKGIQDFFSQ